MKSEGIVTLRRVSPLVAALMMASILGGCGPGGSSSSSPGMSDRSSKEAPSEARSRETAGTEAASTLVHDRFVGAGANAKEPNPEERLQMLRAEIDGGAEPTSAEILYAALKDPEPKVQKEVSEWLRTLVEAEPDARKKIEELQRKERDREVFQRAADVLTPRPEEPATETIPEAGSERNG